MRGSLLSLFVLAGHLLLAQNPNALDFDGSNDYVSVPNGSGLLVGQTAWSMSCWAYLTNAAPAYPNFDGIIGIRNESNCDFYLLQLSNTKIEARFRNSSGTAYSIVSNNAVNLNSWTHYALVYTGSSLKFYKNGVMTDSIYATGSFSLTNVAFEIGRSAFQSNPFMLDGKVDEVSLWTKALSHQEVTCLYSGNIHPNSTDLELYYDFNEGVAGGNNAGITNLPNLASSGHNGTLNGFGLNGTTSNWVSGIQNTSMDSIKICYGATDSINGVIIDSAGVYPIYMSDINGCDSLVYYTVEEKDSIDTQIMITLSVPPVLGAISGYDAYQWLRCEANGLYSEINGQTDPSFQPSSNGDYAVAIEFDGCSDTSDCVTVSGIGIEEVSISDFYMLPNPALHQVRISGVQGNTSFRMTDLNGRVILEGRNNGEPIDISTFSPGIYFVELIEFRKVTKLIVN